MSSDQDSSHQKSPTLPLNLDNLLSYKVALLILAFLSFSDILLLFLQNAPLTSGKFLNYNYIQLLLSLFLSAGLFGIFLKFMAIVQLLIFSLSLSLLNLLPTSNDFMKEDRRRMRDHVMDDELLDFILSQDHDILFRYRGQEQSRNSEIRSQSLLMFTLGILLLCIAFFPQSSIYQLVSQYSGMNVVTFSLGLVLSIRGANRYPDMWIKVGEKTAALIRR